MTLHLSKEEFNKEIQRLHNRINFLTRHVAKQNEEIENLKIKNRLLHAKNEILEDFETDTTDREASSFFGAGKPDPTEALAKEYYALGTEAAELKSFQKAVKYFTRVTELIPTAKRGYVKLAVLHYQLEEFEDSRTNALQALKLGSISAQKILDKIEAKTAAQ